MSRGRRARIQLHLHIQREKIVVRVCSMRRLKSKFNTERSRIDPVICTSPNQEPVSFVIGPAVINTHTVKKGGVLFRTGTNPVGGWSIDHLGQY
jgi:hypothetical protein